MVLVFGYHYIFMAVQILSFPDKGYIAAKWGFFSSFSNICLNPFSQYIHVTNR